MNNRFLEQKVTGQSGPLPLEKRQILYSSSKTSRQMRGTVHSLDQEKIQESNNIKAPGRGRRATEWFTGTTLS